MPNACAVCGKEATSRCSKCHSVYYCDASHQKNDYPKHKPKCAALAAEHNLAEGQQFLADKAKEEGVQAATGGLLYKILTKGNGTEKPKATDKVEVHYKGTLINGKEFDSSYKRGQTISFGLNQVIKGWTVGVQLMSIGDKFEFYIPSDMAYGPGGAGADIPGNSTLIFVVELFGINGKK